MAHLLRLWASSTELEELEAVLATQELLAFENVDISECLGGWIRKKCTFPTTVKEIEQSERDRIPKKTRQRTAWSVNVYRAWAEYRNTQIDWLFGDEYRSAPVDLGTTPVEEVNYWLTRLMTWPLMTGSHERWWQAVLVPVPVFYILVSMHYFLISQRYIEHTN